MLFPFIVIGAFLVHNVASQQIWDIWQTTWDRAELFTSLEPKNPINFISPSVIGSADIDVDDTATFQSVWGFGGSLSELIHERVAHWSHQIEQAKNQNNYWELINYLFSPTDGANAAGLSYLRVPLGASDFSSHLYSFDDTNGDTSFSKFNINAAPAYVFSVIKDIQSPGWMKDSGTMNGGSLKSNLASPCLCTYLLKCLQGFQSNGVKVYAISIQNEPQNSNPTYPTAKLTPTMKGKLEGAPVGYEHNWDDAAARGDVFDGVAFHCYAGSVDQQDSFHTKFPTKCAGTIGSDWWSDIKLIGGAGAVTHNSHSVLMWNIALDGQGNPKLPGTSSCGGNGCRAIAQVNSDGTYSLNQEFYAMAQASKATIPRDNGGPWGKRIRVTVGGQLNWALRVGAYVTGRVKSTDWLRYSLVVLNWDDSIGGWSPTPVQTTIEFRGKQATYTFPVGVTTLWWYGEL
ncbi:glycoside hydrolase superfamily [Infundibulicybe gibba]|nr:glycoside hydrolase superfamily [Infundibulicybe gibba]